ncbi:MAG: preprotein translocase subunit SecE [Clostridia bacterium]|nr:preprotein translocase subunit SecE [Clostridia bacterium]
MKAISNFFGRIAKFFREVKVEIKKIIWPTWEQIRNNTGVVILCILVIGIAIWILDAIFGFGVKTFLGSGAKQI